MSKRAQMGEYIGIAVLMIIVVLFVIFTRFQATESTISQAESALGEYRGTQLDTSAVTFSYATVDGIPINELLGVYRCYESEIADYGGIKINITKHIEQKFDMMYSQNRWVLELNLNDDSKVFLKTGGRTETRTGLFPTDRSYKSYDFVFPIPCDGTKLGRGVIYAWE